MPTTNSIPPLTLISDIYPLTQEQLLDLRKIHLRDLVTVAGLDSVIVASAGTGYVQGAAITVVDAAMTNPGSGASGYVNVDGAGAILSVKITNPGTGYTLASTTVSVSGGSMATLTPVVTSTKLSAYNKATSQQFVDDSSLQAMLYNLLVDKQQLLVNAWNTHYADRIARTDDSPTAEVLATVEQLNVIYRFLRADVRESMVDDPAYQASVPEANRKQWSKDWRTSIIRDRNWGRQRSPGFASCEVLVK